MKRITCILSFVILSFCAFSQQSLELKSNPLPVLIEDGFLLPISAEYIVNPKLGIELDIIGAGFRASGSGGSLFGGGAIIYGSARHYFSPKKGGDRFYVVFFAGGMGIYTEGWVYGYPYRDLQTTFGGGPITGYKWVFNKNILLDVGIGLGAGTGTSGGLDALPYAKLHLGYRFNFKKNK